MIACAIFALATLYALNMEVDKDKDQFLFYLAVGIALTCTTLSILCGLDVIHSA